MCIDIFLDAINNQVNGGFSIAMFGLLEGMYFTIQQVSNLCKPQMMCLYLNLLKSCCWLVVLSPGIPMFVDSYSVYIFRLVVGVFWYQHVHWYTAFLFAWVRPIFVNDLKYWKGISKASPPLKVPVCQTPYAWVQPPCGRVRHKIQRCLQALFPRVDSTNLVLPESSWWTKQAKVKLLCWWKIMCC